MTMKGLVWRIFGLEEQIAQKIGDRVLVLPELQSMIEKVETYHNALSEIREIYAGMDGFIPETAPESYQQRVIKQMYGIAVGALKVRK